MSMFGKWLVLTNSYFFEPNTYQINHRMVMSIGNFDAYLPLSKGTNPQVDHLSWEHQIYLDLLQIQF